MDYFNPKLRVHVLKKDNIDNLPLNEGNLIVSQDGGEMYFDLEEERVQIVPLWNELKPKTYTTDTYYYHFNSVYSQGVDGFKVKLALDSGATMPIWGQNPDRNVLTPKRTTTGLLIYPPELTLDIGSGNFIGGFFGSNNQYLDNAITVTDFTDAGSYKTAALAFQFDGSLTIAGIQTPIISFQHYSGTAGDLDTSIFGMEFAIDYTVTEAD